jgi:hypothetical protein
LKALDEISFRTIQSYCIPVRVEQAFMPALQRNIPPASAAEVKLLGIDQL